MELREMIVEEAAGRRANLHRGKPGSRPFFEGHEKVGLKGEWAFGEWSGLMPDLTDKPKGDGGVDFWLPCTLSVDIKTSRSGRALLHERGKKMADIFVLAVAPEGSTEVELVGWEWGTVLASKPAVQYPSGLFNHEIPRGELRPMDSLRRMIPRRF
jgi:hypothetical protein